MRRMAEDGQLDTDGQGHYLVPPLSPVTPVTDVTDEEPESDSSDGSDTSPDLGAYTSDDYEEGT